MYRWQQINHMQFNENKFELLRYGKNQDIKDSTSYFAPNSGKINKPNVSKSLVSK